MKIFSLVLISVSILQGSETSPSNSDSTIIIDNITKRESEPIFHYGRTDTLYYARSLTNYVIPTYKLRLPGKLSTGDTLGVLFSGDIDLKLQRAVKKQLAAMGAFNHLSAMPVDGGYELLYEYKRSKSFSRHIKLPEISLPSGSKVDYVEYSVRDSEKGGVNATMRRILQFNDVSFEIEEYARYEGILDGEVLPPLPPIKLTQDRKSVV